MKRLRAFVLDRPWWPVFDWLASSHARRLNRVTPTRLHAEMHDA